MTKTRKSKRVTIAIILAIVMALGVAMPVFATSSTQLAMTVVQTPNEPNMSRATGWDHVPGAGSYIMFVFDDYTAAEDATAETVAELAAASAEFEATGERIVTDVRMITFVELNGSGAVRAAPIPADWEPAGLGASAFAAGSVNGANTTNLVPGQYWIRVQAIAEDQAANTDSELSEVHAIVDSFNIAMGPDEAKAYIERRLADVGTTLHIIDVRGENPQETGDEGYIRYTTAILPTLRFVPDTRADEDLLAGFDEVLLAGVDNDPDRRGEVTVMLY
jgi:hypothetical protein